MLRGYSFFHVMEGFGLNDRQGFVISDLSEVARRDTWKAESNNVEGDILCR